MIDKPHSGKITFNAYTKDQGSNLDISSGILTVNNKDILVPSPLTSYAVERSIKELGRSTTVTITFQTPFALMANSQFKI